ncbi:MAG: Rab family GTPase [Candidatus Hermodarchaeota archaeon]
MRIQNLRAKILLIGDGGVGKTAFRQAWFKRPFTPQYLMTIGADFASKETSLYHSSTKKKYNIRYQIWDLAGQPRFKVVRELYYRGAVGALCFFDITNQDSFVNLVNWIKSYWKLNGQGKRPFVIVGAKADLRRDPTFQGQVAPRYGIKYARDLTKLVQQKHGFTVHYIETSAKENINVDETFQLLSKEIINSITHKKTVNQSLVSA